MNINLHIDRLILDGVDLPANQQAVMQAALETELSALLSVQGLQPGLVAGGAIRTLQGETITLPTDHNPTALGQQIARAVYGGIGG